MCFVHKMRVLHSSVTLSHSFSTVISFR